jgi:hypothetical protein
MKRVDVILRRIPKIIHPKLQGDSEFARGRDSWDSDDAPSVVFLIM